MTTTTKPESLRARLHELGLYGLLAHFEEIREQPWIDTVLEYEQAERARRSLERRIKNARVGAFKPMADFDWKWPAKIDRTTIEELFTFTFIDEGANVVLVGPNGIGKSMVAKNLAHQALLRGYTVRFTTASDMLHDLANQETDSSLTRRLRRYCHPQLLVLDEVGYLSYDARYADLLFEVVTRRYEHLSIVVTTNKSFTEWTDVFPNAACVVTLVDRLIHRAEVTTIDGESYRLKEAKERAKTRRKPPRARKTMPG
jgi:DNA replication protein DnaC